MVLCDTKHADFHGSYGDMELPVPAFFADQLRSYVSQGRKVMLNGQQSKYLLVNRTSQVYST
jgi:hypothetical protein